MDLARAFKYRPCGSERTPKWIYLYGGRGSLKGLYQAFGYLASFLCPRSAATIDIGIINVDDHHVRPHHAF